MCVFLFICLFEFLLVGDGGVFWLCGERVTHFVSSSSCATHHNIDSHLHDVAQAEVRQLDVVVRVQQQVLRL